MTRANLSVCRFVAAGCRVGHAGGRAEGFCANLLTQRSVELLWAAGGTVSLC